MSKDNPIMFPVESRSNPSAEPHPKRKKKTEPIPAKIPFLYDRIPRELVREWMAGWDLCRLRCYLYIADKTWGYGKEWDAISISQFCGGVDGAGDRGAGYSETPVKAAIKALWLDGFIRIIFRPIHEKKANLYALTHPDCVELQATENRQIERERRASMPPDVGKHRMPKAECKVRKVARWTATEG